TVLDVCDVADCELAVTSVITVCNHTITQDLWRLAVCHPKRFNAWVRSQLLEELWRCNSPDFATNRTVVSIVLHCCKHLLSFNDYVSCSNVQLEVNNYTGSTELSV